MQETLFNPPIWMPILLAMVGIAVFVYGNARVQAKVRNGGLGVLGLVVLWSAVAYFVRTPTEQCLDRTRQIVGAVEDGKWDELSKLLDRNTRFAYGMISLDAQRLVRSAQDNAERFGVKDINILSENIDRTPGTIDVTISTLVQGAQNTTAVFKFEYEQRTDGILLSRISALSVGGASTDEISRQVGH